VCNLSKSLLDFTVFLVRMSVACGLCQDQCNMTALYMKV
jgi:formate hydrogenlyase subunit 6/NADH:ubiquinone oxidoreductase subunit I